MAEWTPNDIIRLVTTTTCCVCLFIIVLREAFLAYLGKINPDMFGTISAGGVATGILGLAWVVSRPLLARQ